MSRAQHWTAIGETTTPTVPDALLTRRRLLRTLDAGTRHPVTLVCAGPGWGKTTLVAAWARARPGPGVTAWLTLDERHDDPDVLWPDVEAALRETFERVAEGTVLVLDDVHVLRGQASLERLARMLRELPQQLHVILVSRTEPPIDLHRLRLAGELTEIRAPQLAFRVNEVVELLALRGRRPSAVEAGFLVGRAEGWPVGVQLLGGAFLDRGDDGLNDFPDTLRDYLVREVIAAQPPEIRWFLLRTSVPEEVDADLATALSAERSSEKVLERLERDNAFVTRVAGSGRPFFRYHGLLRETLSRELDSLAPGELPGLHVRAAQWYAGRRMTVEAVAHAAAARDWTFLGRLAVEYALPMAFSRQRTKLADALRQIPAERFAESAELALCAAVLLLISGDDLAADDQLSRVRAMLDGNPPERPTIELAVRIWHIAAEMRSSGDMLRQVAQATRVLADLGRVGLDQVPSLLQYRAMTLGLKGIGLFWSDQGDQADRYLWSASAAARTAGVEFVEVTALAHLSLLTYLQGSLREAERYVSAVEKITGRHDLDLIRESAPAHLLQALIELERNRVTEAQEALRRGVHASGERPAVALQILAAVVRARLLLAGGESEAARDLLRRIAADLGPSPAAPLATRWLRLAEAETDLAMGEPAAVVARYEGAAPTTVLLVPEQTLLARAYEMSGDHEEAEELAARLREGGDTVSAVTAWVVTALIADAQGHARRSADALAHAVLRAQADGIRRPFHAFDNRRMLMLAERQRWLYEERSPEPGSLLAEPGFPPLPAVPDTLSEREHDILRYLPTVLTASEIAADLNISVNTVKAHMRAIYRKLGAARRREAVVRARQIGLL
jgi:LuxR family maltose regulon positive regulatory protein